MVPNGGLGFICGKKVAPGEASEAGTLPLFCVVTESRLFETSV